MSKKTKVYKLSPRRSIEAIVKNRNSWTFTIAVVGITATICFLLITGRIDIDSSTLLSLILAFFSIYLSAQFYFKATEQSNQFYNTAFNHNKNISESLSGMRGEFGTSLRMIEESSNYLRGRFDEIGKISEGLENLNEVQEEVKKGFESLYEKSGITAAEKDRYNELLETQSIIVNQLDMKLKEVEKIEGSIPDNMLNDRLKMNYSTEIFLKTFYDQYGSRLQVSNLSRNDLNKMFHEYKKNNNLPHMLQRGLTRGGYVDDSGNLTGKGYRLIRNNIRSHHG